MKISKSYRNATLLLFCISVAPLASANQLYNLTRLGALDANNSIALGINDLGQVVGESWIGGNNQAPDAILWSAGILTDLGHHSIAYSINDAGVIAGASKLDPNASGVATVWNGGVPTVVGGLYSASTAYDINNAGQAVGLTNSTGSPTLWSGGTTTYLNTQNYSYALGINNSGQVVGQNYVTGRATEWIGGNPTTLAALGANTPYSNAVAINDAGEVVGASSDHNFTSIPTIWINGGVCQPTCRVTSSSFL